MKKKLLKAIIMLSKGFLYTFFLHLIFFTMAAAKSNSQQLSVKDIYVNIAVQEATVAEVFRKIEARSDFTFAYDEKDLNRQVRFTFSGDQSIAAILKKIGEKASLHFRRVNHKIDVTKALKRQDDKIEEVFLEKRITGKVTDETGEGLPGVNIIIKGSTIGTVTDMNGNYSLAVPDDTQVLVFSFIGYKQQEVTIGNRTVINVEMVSDITSLGEVVVIGYGTVKKSDLTGSVSSIDIDEMSQGVTSSVDELLLGKSAGVNVVPNSGEPGGGFSINIRGASSVNAGNGPLYVIDGVPINNARNINGPARSARSALATLNTQDIESIEILKDASATAIYGSRGANGVILITTKSGQSGALKVNYHGYVGIQNIANKLDVLGPDEYKAVVNAIIDAGGEDEEFRVGEITNRTDWQDEISNFNAPVQNQHLSFSGGTENTTYYMSLNYMDQEGIIKGTAFSRYAARVNVESQLSDKFSTGIKITTSYSQDDFGAQEGRNNGAVYSAKTFDPTLPVKNPDGTYALSPFNARDNPMALIEGVDMNSNTNRTLASVFAEYNFTSDLYARVKLGSDFTNETRKGFSSLVTQVGQRNNGVGTYTNHKRNNYLVEGTLHYLKTFGGIHDIDALAGVTYERFNGENVFANASDFPSDALGANGLGLGDVATYNLGTAKFGHRLASYIGRLNYTLKDKYLLTATVRVDGSSRFGENNRFAVFPSLALGWKLTEESFLESIDALSNLKLRASWGQTGNQEIGNYPSISTYSKGQSAVWDNEPVTTTGPSRLPNPDLKWETTEQFNIGVDFGFLAQRITGSFDVYRKKTTDMLLHLPVPQSTGFNTKISNIGSIVNNGIDFSLNSTNISGKDFTWSSDLILSTVNNEVKDIGSLSEINVGGATFFAGDPAIIRPGAPLNSFFGYEVIGVWQEDDDYSVTEDNVHPGSLKFKDQLTVDTNEDGIPDAADGTVNADDRVILGNSFPDVSWSLGNTFTYKGFELFVFIEAVQGIEMLNANKIETYYPVDFRRNRLAEPLLNRWTPENPSDTYPSFVNLRSDGVHPVNSYTVEDASYVKLRTVRLSYTLPRIADFIRNATIYVTGGNLYTITDYDGYDPAVNPKGNANYRIDLNAYPTARTFMVGVQLGL